MFFAALTVTSSAASEVHGSSIVELSQAQFAQLEVQMDFAAAKYSY
jgi:hypothetical protein